MTKKKQTTSKTQSLPSSDWVNKEKGIKPFIPNDPYSISWEACGFIMEMDGRINDETHHFLNNAFKGFRDEVQDKMVKCLCHYFEECGPEGESYLPLLHVEHIDLLQNEIVYKIEHGYR